MANVPLRTEPAYRAARPTGPSPDGGAGDDGPRPARTGVAARVPLVAHVLVLGIALCALLPHMDVRTSWVADEGSYALQVRSLVERGTWQYNYVARDIDPSGAWFPAPGGGGQLHGRFYTYIKHPVHIALIWLSVKVFGQIRAMWTGCLMYV